MNFVFDEFCRSRTCVWWWSTPVGVRWIGHWQDGGSVPVSWSTGPFKSRAVWIICTTALPSRSFTAISSHPMVSSYIIFIVELFFFCLISFSSSDVPFELLSVSSLPAILIGCAAALHIAVFHSIALLCFFIPSIDVGLWIISRPYIIYSTFHSITVNMI